MVPRSFIALLLRYLVLVSSLIFILADENSGTSKLQIQVCFVLIDLMSSCGSFLFSSPFTTFIIALLVGILLHFTALYCTILYCVHYIVDTTGSAKGRWVQASGSSLWITTVWGFNRTKSFLRRCRSVRWQYRFFSRRISRS